MKTFRIRVSRDDLTFSSAHFLLFSNGECERVHGHNYRVWAELEGPLEENDYVFDFTVIRPILKEACNRLDHRVLLPSEHEELKITKGERLVEATFHDNSYRFPAQDVVFLPIRNTSAELLAQYLCRELKKTLNTHFEAHRLTAIRVGVEESFGQEGFYEESF